MAEENCIQLKEPLGKYYVDSRKSSYDIDAAWKYFSTEAYWGRYRTREFLELQVAKAFLQFGLFVDVQGESRKMIGSARVVGDGDNNMLLDVYVDKQYQGSGLGVKFLEVILNAEERSDWRWLSHTSDRSDCYVKKFGFTVIGHATREAMLGMPLFLLERDGRTINYLKSSKKPVEDAAIGN